MTSIRARTSMLVAVSSAALLALGGLTLFMVVRAALTRQFDDGLAARVAALQSLARFDGAKVEMDIAGEFMPRYQTGNDAEFFIAWVRGAGGWTVLEQSESLRTGVWPLVADRPPAPGAGDCALPQGLAGRALTIDFVPLVEREGESEREAAPSAAPARPPAPPVRLLVAQSRGPLDRTLWTIALSIVGVGIALVLASSAATRWAVRRGTRPLETLSAHVAEIGPDTLDQRLALDRLPAELAPIAGRLNDLLARLDNAFARERRFTSAASHELRTPIAELRMLLEVGLSRARTAARWEQTARDGLGVLDRAQRLTEALLRLSRASAGPRYALPDATIDLAAVLREQAARALVASGHDPAHLSIDAAGPLPVRIDPILAASVLGNLIDNALRHGAVTADHPVRCVGTADAQGSSIIISNAAPSLSAADLAHLFEPFWRKDAARDAHGGFGLGLAVSRALAESAGARLTIQLSADKRVQAILWLPRP
ncbi:hypothetical protein BH11PLA1_BH11PLA1_11270 [soil metagenome]